MERPVAPRPPTHANGLALSSRQAACAIAVGHGLGGPNEEVRSTLAIASAMRHPGIALAPVAVKVPKAPQVGAAVLTYLLVSLVRATLYGRFRQPHPTG